MAPAGLGFVALRRVPHRPTARAEA